MQNLWSGTIMKIWLRTGKKNLTHARTVFGTSISYDELCSAFNRMDIECKAEFPEGNAYNSEQYIPDDRENYIEMLYGYPEYWEIDRKMMQRDDKLTLRKGLVAYIRAGEIGFTTEEIHKLNICDTVFVASTSAKAHHQHHIITPPTGILSGGFNPSQFYYIARDFHTNPFIFLHLGAAQWRKGSDIACEAFSKAFDSLDINDVQLLILAPGETEMFHDLRQRYSYDDRIKFVVKVVSDRDKMLSEYYMKGHVLVYPSVTEAWGRCLAEAMASGMPCIVARTSAMLDQFSEECGWWIKMGKRQGEYLLPSTDSLVVQMRYAYEHREECEQKGKAAAIFALEYLTWEYGINKALSVLKAIDETRFLKEVSNQLPKPIKLNIGCDMLLLDGWVNTDIGARRINARNILEGVKKSSVYLHDVRYKMPFDEHKVSAITISHVLNIALYEEEYLPFLQECHRVLEPGGVLRVTQDNPDEYFFPSLSYVNAQTMRDYLKKTGFMAKETDSQSTVYDDRSICINTHGDAPKCYFCEGIKC